MSAYANDRIELEGKIEEDDKVLRIKDVVLCREMVQPYPDGLALKDGEELEKAAWTLEGRWIRAGAHPETPVILQRADIHGKVYNIRFIKNLKDAKTGRPIIRGIVGDIDINKSVVAKDILDGIRSKERKDVSVGFHHRPDKTPGKWNGDPYDYIQRDICFDHVAIGLEKGRCSYPLCGIGADEMKAAGDPEETENYVHVPVRNANQFVDGSFRTITLSEEEGIQAVIGKLKSDPDGSTHIQKYVFAKSKDWTMEKAKKWIEEHGKDEDMHLSKTDALTINEIKKKIDELTKKRSEIQTALSKLRETKPDEEKLWNDLQNLDMEIMAYREGMINRIAQGGDEVKVMSAKLVDDLKKKIKLDALTPEQRNAYIHILDLLCPECPPALDYGKAPEDEEWNYDESAYDIDQLKRAAAVVETPEEGKEMTKQMCHLPHHKPDGTLVWRGVSTAGAALMGSRGGVKLSEDLQAKAKSHLEHHYSEFDKTPPWKEEPKDAKTTLRESNELLRRSQALIP